MEIVIVWELLQFCEHYNFDQSTFVFGKIHLY